MDGTVCRYHEALERDLRDFFGKDRNRVSQMTVAKAGFLIRAQPGWYYDLEPIPFGFQIVDYLRKMGFSIMVLTKGNRYMKNAWTEKVEWCKKYIPDAKVTITEDKGLVYGKVLVDDWPDYATRWLSHRPRGIVLMPKKPWNKDFKKTVEGGLIRVFKVGRTKDLHDIRPILRDRLEVT